MKYEFFEDKKNKSRIDIEKYLIKHISLAITNRCNLKCDYCYKSVKKDGIFYDIPFDSLKSLIDNLLKININGNTLETVQLIGGEPTCHENFFDICEYLISKNLEVRISTNGTNSRIIKSDRLKRLYINGKIEFRVSLDEIPGKNDSGFRGNCTDTICENIKYLIDNGANVSVKSVITKSNIDFLEKFLLFIKNLGVKTFSYSSLYNLGGHSLNYEEFYQKNYISDFDVYKKFIEIMNRKPELISMLKANIIYHILHLVFIKNPEYFFTKFYLYFHYTGNIYCQDQLISNDFCIGNIYKIDNLENTIDLLRYKKLKYEIYKEKCIDCEVFNYCIRGNYGELFTVDKNLSTYFPTCDDLKKLIKHIIKEPDEAKNLLIAMYLN